MMRRRTYNNKISSESGKYMLASNAVLAYYRASDLLFSDAYGDTWRVLESAGKRCFTSFAISSNGEVMTATYANSLSAGGIITSRDKGKTWVESALLDVACYSVDMSRDGKTQVAVGNLEKIARSVDYGKTWELIPTSESTYWRAVAMSNDGKYIIAIPTSGGGIRISFNHGVTWNLTGIINNSSNQSAAISDNGKYQYISTSSIYRSTNSGESFDKTDLYGGAGIAVLGDGKDVILASDKTIYRSYDYGVSLEQIHTASGYPSQLAASSDGLFILQGNQTEYAILSKDGGITWKEIPNSNGWCTVAINK